MSALLAVEDLVVDIHLLAGTLHAVRGISFSVEKGETLCIVGESGCGKSISALAVMGLLPRTAERRAGQLAFAGQDLLRLRESEMARIRGNRMAMIFQDPMTSLNPVYTIGNQLEETLMRHRRASRREARERAVNLLEKVGITAAGSRLRQYPHQLSGGLRQRVMIAMALMCGPDLLIADEPTTALDVTIQAEILALLAGLQRELGMSLILISHDLGVVARIADQVAVMYAGQIVEHGAVADVFRAPLHPYTQGLFACIPVPAKTPRGVPLGSIPGVVPSLMGELSGCSFRARCPHAFAECEHTEVALRGAKGAHRFRCLLHSETARRNADKVLVS